MKEAEAISKPTDHPAPLQKSAVEERFTRMAETLDAAGLGPADYLYSSLKWRLQKPDVNRLLFRRVLWRSVKNAISNPLPVPRELPHAPILVATSYLVAAKLFHQVVAALEPAERVFYCLGEIPPQPLPSRLADYSRAAAALGPGLDFAMRVRSTLGKAGVAPVERDRAALAAFSHRMHRPAARSILNKVRPKCVVIGNGNRPLEFSLFSEARARGLDTVLLPYTEVTLKPARFLSLCRGVFDLVLPFSESSAAQMRRLNPNVQTTVVGFPVGFKESLANADEDDKESAKPKADRVTALYFAGTNFEEAAADLMREVFEGSTALRLRVRLHPRAGPEDRKVFDWLQSDDISDPHRVPLAEDIENSDVVLAIRSTAAIEAMIAGVPCVWLSPETAREQLKFSTLRKQNFTPLEALTSSELREIVERLHDDEVERERVINEQWSRLRAAGYDRDYFQLVASALRQLIAIVKE